MTTSTTTTRTLCNQCEAELTSTDRQAGYCTQCGYGLRPQRRLKMNLNETCKHGSEPIYRCPVNADHDEVSLSDKPGECSECGAELEMI